MNTPQQPPSNPGMMRVTHHLPNLSHAKASLIAQLVQYSTFEADDIEYFRRMLAKYSPAEFLAAIDQAQRELAVEGQLPARPSGRDAASFFLLYDGLCELDREQQLVVTESYPLAA